MCACVHVCIYVGHVAQYPEYLRAKEAVLSPTEAARFSCQHEVIVRICAEYEQGSPDLGAITELMREVCVCVCMCVCVHVCVPAYLWLLSQTDDKVAWERSLHPRRNIEPNVPA